MNSMVQGGMMINARSSGFRLALIVFASLAAFVPGRLWVMEAMQNAGKAMDQPGHMKTDENGTRHFVSAAVAKNYLAPNIPPASCAEWATQSLPIAGVTAKCKSVGGTNLCGRVSGIHGGSYDIGPLAGRQQVGQALTVHFRIRDFGSGDYIIYSFGKVDWGDNSQQDIFPFGFDQQLSHTYTTQGPYVIHAMGGAQFKYQGGPISGSYEGCVDNSIPVNITP